MRLFDHLEAELDAAGFFRVAAKRPSAVRNLRNILHKGQFTDQEVRTLHGVITALSDHRLGRVPRRRGEDSGESDGC